jgi:protoporphyrinogen oxidase
MIPAAPTAIHDAAARLINNSVMIINIGVDRSNLSEFQWIYFDGEEPFYRVHFPSNLSRFCAPKGAGAVCVEIAYSRFRPLKIGREKLFKLTVDRLTKTGILRSSDNIIFQNIIDQKYAYVIYDQYRETCVRKLRDYLRKYDIETCGRFGEWAYLWMDQSILSGRRAAEAILKP